MEARFAFSGKIASVYFTKGQRVAKGDLIASLDCKQLQTELDRQLADYERVRAEFDLFTSQSHPDDDTTKFLRTGRQATLNAAVKDVELAKVKLDQANLFSPVNGVILEADNLVPGVYVTPASASVRILNRDILSFVFFVSEKQLEDFRASADLTITFSKQKEKVTAKSRPLLFGENGKFLVCAPLPGEANVLAGMTGEAKIDE